MEKGRFRIMEAQGSTVDRIIARAVEVTEMIGVTSAKAPVVARLIKALQQHYPWPARERERFLIEQHWQQMAGFKIPYTTRRAPGSPRRMRTRLSGKSGQVSRQESETWLDRGLELGFGDMGRW